MLKGASLSERQKLILNSVQDAFPVESRPYEALSKKLDELYNLKISEEEIIKELYTLKEQGYIRRLGAILNIRSLGYKSTLCAAKVPNEKIENLASIINSYPQVTHNYIRNNELNVWFTFCYSDRSELTPLLDKLTEELGENKVFELNSSKTFKIKAVFNLKGDDL
jgi:DNA-binding Lrp family transcriptional regulator